MTYLKKEANKEHHKRFLQRNEMSNINYINTDDKNGYILTLLKDYPKNHPERIKYERRIKEDERINI